MENIGKWQPELVYMIQLQPPHPHPPMQAYTMWRCRLYVNSWIIFSGWSIFHPGSFSWNGKYIFSASVCHLSVHVMYLYMCLYTQMIWHKKKKENKKKSAHEPTMVMPSNKRQNVPCEGWSSGHGGGPDGVLIISLCAADAVSENLSLLFSSKMFSFDSQRCHPSPAGSHLLIFSTQK